MARKPPYGLAFVLTSFGRGGMETRLADVVGRLDPQRWDAHIYALYDRQTQRQFVAPEHLHLPFSKGKYDLLPSFRLAQVFRARRPVLVWALAQGLAAGWGRLAALLSGVPLRVLSIHDHYPLAPLTRLLNPWTQAIVTNSHASATLLSAQGIPPAKLHVFYNGVDTSLYRPGTDRRADLFNIPPMRPVILNIGRLFPEKGRDVMLQAAALLLPSDNPPLVVFAGEGEGSQRAALEKLAHNLGLNGMVRFLGLRDDVPDLLRSADVVVMSSRDVPFGESCPNVVLEGMATGLPVVGTDVGGTRELIGDGETGYLIAPERPDLLAERLGRLLQDSTLRARMGAAGRQRIEAAFTLEKMVADRVRLFEALLAAKGL
jgi:glycosyltransferase involved in cell wall biosynthesis